MTPFPLVILTPDRECYHGSADCVTAPGQDGEFGVLANHIPLVAGLKAGVLHVRAPGGETRWFAVDGGVLGIDSRGARILTDRVAAAETPEAAQRTVADWARAAAVRRPGA